MIENKNFSPSEQPREKSYAFEDELVTPPDPLLPDGNVDLNEFARQSRDGERRPIMTISEAVYSQGGFHNTHMQNPELHPPLEGQIIPDLRMVQAAVKALRAAEAGDELHQ